MRILLACLVLAQAVLQSSLQTLAAAAAAIGAAGFEDIPGSEEGVEWRCWNCLGPRAASRWVRLHCSGHPHGAQHLSQYPHAHTLVGVTALACRVPCFPLHSHLPCAMFPPAFACRCRFAHPTSKLKVKLGNKVMVAYDPGKTGNPSSVGAGPAPAGGGSWHSCGCSANWWWWCVLDQLVQLHWWPSAMLAARLVLVLLSASNIRWSWCSTLGLAHLPRLPPHCGAHVHAFGTHG